MKSVHALTDQQLAILGVVWSKGEATANEIHLALEPTAGLARGTVGTMLHRLERQGILVHRSEGREFWYRSAVSRDEVMAARVRGLVGGLFGGDLSAMVSFAVSKSETRRGDLEKLKKLLDDHHAKRGAR